MFSPLHGAYKSGKTGKPGNVTEFCNSGKLREFEMYSGNFFIMQSATSNTQLITIWYL